MPKSGCGRRWRPRARPEAVSVLMETWPDGRETWSAVRRFGPECVMDYWTRRRPSYLTGSRRALLERILMFLRFGRAARPFSRQ